MGMTRHVVRTLAVSAAVACTWPSLARGQTPVRGDKVAAEALFEDARKLAAAGKFSEACPKFGESERLDPSAATLLNLASCWEKMGMVATAWATYREAASAANAAGRSDYRVVAERHADALAPRLPRLTLSVTAPAEGIEVQRDGVVIAPASWGFAIPIDPGTHTITAAAPGHKSWTATVDVPSDGTAAPVAVTIPPLEVLPAESPAAAPWTSGTPAGAAPGAIPLDRAPGADSSRRARARSTQRLGAGIAAGLGVLGVTTGAVFAAIAKSRYDDSVSRYCLASDKNSCSDQGVRERNDARTAGDVASWTLGLGAAALAGGVVLWLTAPKAEGGGAGHIGIAIVPTLGGARVDGAF